MDADRALPDLPPRSISQVPSMRRPASMTSRPRTGSKSTYRQRDRARSSRSVNDRQRPSRSRPRRGRTPPDSLSHWRQDTAFPLGALDGWAGVARARCAGIWPGRGAARRGTAYTGTGRSSRWTPTSPGHQGGHLEVCQRSARVSTSSPGQARPVPAGPRRSPAWPAWDSSPVRRPADARSWPDRHLDRHCYGPVPG